MLRLLAHTASNAARQFSICIAGSECQKLLGRMLSANFSWGMLFPQDKAHGDMSYCDSSERRLVMEIFMHRRMLFNTVYLYMHEVEVS